MYNKAVLLDLFNGKKILNIEKYIKSCLYGKKGYYTNSNVIGLKGDFITAPEISQLFGEIIGLFILNYWQNYINKSFNLIELGPGKGTFLIDMLQITKSFKNFHQSININLIEKNNHLIKMQKKNFLINNYRYLKINWSKKKFPNKTRPTIIFANEFFDCLPIRQFFHKENQWFEKKIQIDYENSLIKIIDKKIYNSKILGNIKKYKPNEVLEISKFRENYFNLICKYINTVGGLIIIIDYGYFQRPSHFTLQSVFNNKMSNILDNPGQQDITSLVDFKTLIEIAKKNKLKTDIFCSQREFLLNYGIIERSKIILKNSTKKQKEMIETGIKRMIDKNNMGSLFKVLVLSKKI